MIKGLSERRRLPRLGKIKLGITVQEPGKRPYPKSVDYFVVPPEVQKVFGEHPKELSVMLPSDDPTRVFAQDLKMYRTSGLWCMGDGERARRWGKDGKLVEVECPCSFLESGECGAVATLNLVLPDVPGVGVYQLTTGNKRSIVQINSQLEDFLIAFGGLRGVPFTLKLEPEQIQRYDEKRGSMVKQTLHVLRLDTPYTLREIVGWRKELGKAVEALMPAPDDDEPHEQSAPTHASEPHTQSAPKGESEPRSLSAPIKESEPSVASAPTPVSEPIQKSAPSWPSEPKKTSAPKPSSEPSHQRAPEGASEPCGASAPMRESEPGPQRVPKTESEPEDGSAPKYESKPSARSAPNNESEWTIERLYRTAQSIGVSPSEYTAFLKRRYRVGDVSDLVGPQITNERQMFETATGKQACEMLAKSIIAAAKKAERT